MLESTKVGTTSVEITEFEWHSLTQIEQSLIAAYRRLSELERQHLRRLTNALAANPEEGQLP